MSDELEARVAALEAVVLEVLADLPPARIGTAITRIAAEILAGEDRRVQTHAVAILQAALTRQAQAVTGAGAGPAPPPDQP